jgi:hypothetical protein
MRHPLHIWESALEDHAPHFTPGTPIFDADGVQVGVVSPYHTQGAELLMRKGRFWFATDVVIPLDAIAAVDAQGIRLRFRKAEVDRQAWSGVSPSAIPATMAIDPLLPAGLTSPPAGAAEGVEPPPGA